MLKFFQPEVGWIHENCPFPKTLRIRKACAQQGTFYSKFYLSDGFMLDFYAFLSDFLGGQIALLLIWSWIALFLAVFSTVMPLISNILGLFSKLHTLSCYLHRFVSKISTEQTFHHINAFVGRDVNLVK